MKKQLELLATKEKAPMAICAYPVGSDRLMLAVDIADYSEKREGVSAILEVTLGKKLGISILHEAPSPAIDYVYDAGWHGLLRRDGITQLHEGSETFTPVPRTGKSEPRGLARAGGVVYSCGTADDGVDGYIGRIDGKKWKSIASMSDGYESGTFNQLAFAAPDRGYACGSWGALFTGADTWKPVKLPDTAFATTPEDTSRRLTANSLHINADGEVLLAGNDLAAIYDGKTLTRFPEIKDKRAAATTSLAGEDYWVYGNGMKDSLELYKRKGTKLAAVAKAKFSRIRWWPHPYAGLRAVTHDGRMAISYDDRIHLFDGTAWSQLKLQPDPDALVKRVPVGFK